VDLYARDLDLDLQDSALGISWEGSDRVVEVLANVVDVMVGVGYVVNAGERDRDQEDLGDRKEGRDSEEDLMLRVANKTALRRKKQKTIVESVAYLLEQAEMAMEFQYLMMTTTFQE